MFEVFLRFVRRFYEISRYKTALNGNNDPLNEKATLTDDILELWGKIKGNAISCDYRNTRTENVLKALYLHIFLIYSN